MKNINAYNYDSKPTQPREAKAMKRISDSEIRLKVLESKEFAYAAGEKLRDELTNEQAALLGYYLLAKDVDTVFDSEMFHDHAWDILYPLLKQVLDSEIEDYKDKHELNYDPEEEE